MQLKAAEFTEWRLGAVSNSYLIKIIEMYHKLKITLLQAFGETKRKIENPDAMIPTLNYEDFGEHFQSTVINDARKLGFIEVDSKGFRIKRKYLYMNSSEFQAELSL